MPSRQVTSKRVCSVASEQEKKIIQIKKKLMVQERGMKQAYFNEVGLRQGEGKWEFVQDLNRHISGEAYKLAAMGVVQKELVDSWTEEDYREMRVTKEEVLKELQYKDILKLLTKQYDKIEDRKEKSRTKLNQHWGRIWRYYLRSIMPPWEGEHFLRHLALLASQFPKLTQVVEIFHQKIEARTLRSRTRKDEFLKLQDVKDTLVELEMQRRWERSRPRTRKRVREEEEENEEEGEEENEEEGEEENEEVGKEEEEEKEVEKIEEVEKVEEVEDDE